MRSTIPEVIDQELIPQEEVRKPAYFQWLLCPVCGSKTRLKIRADTVLENFPLYCPKCKQENLINVHKMNISIIKEPDAQTQSR